MKFNLKGPGQGKMRYLESTMMLYSYSEGDTIFHAIEGAAFSWTFAVEADILYTCPLRRFE